MPDRSLLLIPSTTFLVSAICVLATPIYTLMACPQTATVERDPQPAVTELLKQNEAVAVAAELLREEKFDLSVMEVLITDDNLLWRWYASTIENDSPSDLSDALSRDPYWAVYFRPKRIPGYVILDGDMWVFVRRSDLKVLGRL